jgi:hypothetical protein
MYQQISLGNDDLKKGFGTSLSLAPVNFLPKLLG